MRNILLTSILFNVFFLSDVFSQMTLQQEGLKGKVLEVNQTIYEVAKDSSGKIIAGKRVNLYQSNYTRFFNDSGLIAEEIYYKAPDAIMVRRTYEYNSSNQLQEELLYDAEDKVLNKYYFKYDIKGLLSERIVYKKQSKWQYVYDNVGKRIEEKSIDATGKVDSRKLMKYDPTGRMIEEAEITAEGLENIKDVYEYDTNNFVVERIHSISQGSIKQEYTYSYLTDTTGNWLEQIEYKSGKPYRIAIRTIRYKKNNEE